MHIRFLILLALPVLAGCSSTSSKDADWRRIQAERLAKMHDSRDFDAALERLRRHPPARAAQDPRPVTAPAGNVGPQGEPESRPVVAPPEPEQVTATLPVEHAPEEEPPVGEPVIEDVPVQEAQDPRQEPPRPKLDQRLPQGPDVGPRSYRGATSAVRISAEGGIGTLQVIAPRSTLSDRTDAAFLQVGIESNADAARSPGLHLSGFSSDREMFGKSLTNDGVVPAEADARVVGAKAFPHVRFDAIDDRRWAMPVRLGVAVGYLDIEHRKAGVSRDWLTLGPRFEVEPSYALFGGRDDRLELFGRLAGEVGYGYFREDFRGGSDHDRMAQWGYEAGLGLRWNLSDWSVDLGYEFGQTRMSATDTALFNNRTGTKVEHQNVFLGGSFRF